MQTINSIPFSSNRSHLREHTGIQTNNPFKRRSLPQRENTGKTEPVNDQEWDPES